MVNLRVPEQIESRESEECYWELKKFLVLALKANPNILECLFTPMIEQRSEIADALLAKRHIFLSKLVYHDHPIGQALIDQIRITSEDLKLVKVLDPTTDPKAFAERVTVNLLA